MKQPSLTDIKRHYVGEGRSLDAATEAALKEDPRPGARAILQAIARRRFENRAEGQRLRRLTRFERALWDKGILQVAGVDEAGMSPLAGPVSAAAVIFLPGARIPGVDDSKKLNAAEREHLAAEIKRTACSSRRPRSGPSVEVASHAPSLETGVYHNISISTSIPAFNFTPMSARED